MILPARIAVLASGGGSNLQALSDYQRAMSAAASYEIVLVASDKADSGALVRAKRDNIFSAVIDGSPGGSDELLALLRVHRVDIVVLAGYLRLVPPMVVRAFPNRMINVHPAPLPRYGGKGMYGHRVHEAVVANGEPVSGATVHFVDERYDEGGAIAFYPVPVNADDTADTLAERVLRAEHILLPRVLRAVAEGATALPSAPAFDPALTDVDNARALDHHLLAAQVP